MKSYLVTKRYTHEENYTVEASSEDEALFLMDQDDKRCMLVGKAELDAEMYVVPETGVLTEADIF